MRVATVFTLLLVITLFGCGGGGSSSPPPPVQTPPDPPPSPTVLDWDQGNWEQARNFIDPGLDEDERDARLLYHRAR